MDWLFWNNLKQILYNGIMLLPLGVYLRVFFNKKRPGEAARMIFLASLAIEIAQLVLSYAGLVYPRSYDTDDLIFNTLGGMIGFYAAARAIPALFPRLMVKGFKGGEGGTGSTAGR